MHTWMVWGMEQQPFEDEFPIKNGDVLIVMFVFGGVEDTPKPGCFFFQASIVLIIIPMS